MNRTLKPLAPMDFNPLRHRHWIKLRPLESVTDGRRVTVMTFNMLNQSYMWPQVYDSYVPPQYRQWEYRLDLLTKTVKDKSIQSDIMCFQEMEGRAFTSVWAPIFREMGYDGAFIRKDKPGYWRDQDPELIDGVSVFYDTSKFTLVEKKKVVISHYFEEEFKNWYGIKLNSSQIRRILNSKNQVGLIMVLEHTQTKQKFIVSNTHLYWKSGEIKLIQAMILLEAISTMKNKYPGSRILFTGDLNSDPSSPVYRFLKDDRIDILDPALKPFLIERDRKFVVNPVDIRNNVFDTIIKQDELFTCYTPHLFGIFDYIWYSQRDVSLVGFLSGVDPEYLHALPGLPNRDFPSDHIPLVAEFEIN